MPLYPYQCSTCETEFEALVARASSETNPACPDCGSTQTVRGFGLPAKTTATLSPPTNCRGDGPPCGASWCGRSPR